MVDSGQKRFYSHKLSILLVLYYRYVPAAISNTARQMSSCALGGIDYDVFYCNPQHKFPPPSEYKSTQSGVDDHPASRQIHTAAAGCLIIF